MVVVAAGCVSCHTQPLKAEVVGLPAVVKRGEKVSFTVRVKNRSFKEQALPTEYEVRYCTGFRFIPGKKASEYRWGEDGINRNSLDVCPPTREPIAARGTREYVCEWVAPKGVRGEGVFVTDLHGGLSRVEARALTIE